MKIRNISELESLMNDEQKKRARENFEKFYEKPFGCIPEISLVSEDSEDEFLRYVDINDFN